MRRFDVVIGNPPYSDTSSNSTNNSNLDSKFVELGLTLCDRAFFIIRSKHFSDSRSKFRSNLFESGRLERIGYVCPSLFQIDRRVPLCLLSCESRFSTITNVRYKNGSEQAIQASSKTLIDITEPTKKIKRHNLSDRWVRGKTHRQQINGLEDGYKIIVIGGDNETPETSHTTVGVPIGMNSYGVTTNVVNSIGTLGRIFIKPYDTAISSSMILLKCSSQEESVLLHQYLISEEGRREVSINKTTAVASKTMFSYIRDPLI